MTEIEFDKFIQDALRPPQREEDQEFARRVLRGIQIEERLKEQRRDMIRRFSSDLLALTSVAAALLALSLSPALRSISADQFPILLTAVVLSVAAWLWISNSAAARFAGDS